MNKLIVHIGYPRTASSWLQQKVFPCIQNYSFLDRKRVRDALIHPPAFGFDAQTLSVLSQGKPAIISEEMISGRFSGGEINLVMLKEILERIQASFDPVEVVLFIRRQQELIYSLYNLYIRKGGTYSLAKFLRQENKLQSGLLLGSSFFEYDQVVAYIHSRFGTSHTHIFLYEQLRKDPHAFLQDFSSKLGVQLPKEPIDPEKINTGYCPWHLNTKRIFNHFTRHGTPFKQTLLHVPFTYYMLRRKSCRKSAISSSHQEILDTFCGKYANSNLRLSRLEDCESIGNYGYILP